MKQLLSGNDWIVSNFLPDEVSVATGLVQRISNGERYGGEFIPATVPGDVQSDAMDAGLIDEIMTGFKARTTEWTYERDWVYVKRFVPKAALCSRVKLCFDGVDDLCQVYLNGKWLGNHEIAWMPFSFDITDLLLPNTENSLVVIVKAARNQECQWGCTSKVRHLKARFAYGWDWCTRLVPLGIWKDVYLNYEQESVIDDVFVYTDVDYCVKSAVIHAELTLSGKIDDIALSVTLSHPDGTQETKKLSADNAKVCVDFSVDDAKLWYPNGMGEQPLYTVICTLGDNWDERTARIGLRHIEWTRTEGAGEDALPYQPWINGRRVYLQGYNFTPIRQLYGRVQKDVYEKRIALVKRVGANYLRIWGGGLLEREELYDLCDEAGILLMQELFQSSAAINNHPPRDREYIEMMLRVTESAVKQKRNHPSLICWCGGNELCFRGDYMDADGNILVEGVEGMEGLTYAIKGSWVPVSPNYPTLVPMRELVKKLDPQRMWLHTSGSGPVIQNASLDYVGGAMHDVHGPWTILGPTEEYTFYNALDMMIHHEFGCMGSASVQTLETITPSRYLWPLDEMNPFVNYRGRMFAGALRLLRPYFGDAIKDHRTYALASRFIQWEQHRYSLEAHHRLGARCAGSCLWHLGEPWPNVIENSTIDTFDQVKPAYYGQLAAFRTLHLSAHYDSVIHKEQFDVTFALHNTTVSDFAGTIRAQLYDLNGTLLAQQEKSCAVKADCVSACAADMTFTDLPNGVFFLRQTLFDAEGTAVETGYSIHSTADVPYAELLEQAVCDMKVDFSGNILTLRNLGPAVASGLTIECDNDKIAFFSDGCMMLLPGETKTITVEFPDGNIGPLYLSGFGVPYQKINL